ncbi:MAG TPA: D-alanyl-D-alanine carboxypeptidase [Halothiobacillaceae bacterium]|nr:D-alanyl-D-alanine carboxypeptidase [Halothiobacillaceae bacterium]
MSSLNILTRHNRMINNGLFALALLMALCFNNLATANILPGAPSIGAKSYLLMDAKTGEVIVSRDPDTPMPPASISKLMTTYLVFEALENGSISMDDEVLVSEHAWRQGGSRMFIEVGEYVSVHDLIYGMIVQSGNDAAVALAEYVGGNEETFVLMMNAKAQELGLTNSRFQNPTGWPAEDHYMSARDIAELHRDLIKRFPELYEIFRVRSFTYNNITQNNRERLLFRHDWIDGGKTGYTSEAGYCLVTSGKRDGMRLIVVVLNTDSDQARNSQAEALLNYGFRFFENVTIRNAGETLSEPRVFKGEYDHTPVGLSEDLTVLVPKSQRDNINVTLHLDSGLEAPITTGQVMGEIRVRLGDETIATVPVQALADNPEGGLVKRAVDSVWMWFQ